ncbi:MAG: RNA polymerase-binding transcription factor DksA [Nitrosomonadaceae bacterium]|nr:RNA polymerase-binding transcription factor DksA [Nitrosomonadaceae bacterium]
MNELDKIDVSSSEEGEQAQAIAMMRDAQALDSVRQRLERQRAQPSATECESCGDDIPLARQQAVPGTQMCVTCQSHNERFKANYRLPDDN